jgi:hypothetical protein
MKIFSVKKNIFLVFLSILLTTSCSQDEGVGGNSNIRGKLLINYYNDDFSQLLSSEPMPAQDKDLFLIFGDDSVVGEKTSTSYTGDFEFEYLWPGNYKLCYYTEDTLPSLSDKIDTKIIKEIKLAKNETVVLNDLIMYKSLDWNEGTSTISGTVYVKNYKNSSEYPNMIVKDITPAQDIDIYITYGNHKFYDDRIKTSSNGTFVFSNLIRGNYRIFMYSEDIAGGTANKVIEDTIEVTENNQDISISDIFYIEKL